MGVEADQDRSRADRRSVMADVDEIRAAAFAGAWPELIAADVALDRAHEARVEAEAAEKAARATCIKWAELIGSLARHGNGPGTDEFERTLRNAALDWATRNKVQGEVLNDQAARLQAAMIDWIESYG